MNRERQVYLRSPVGWAVGMSICLALASFLRDSEIIAGLLVGIAVVFLGAMFISLLEYAAYKFTLHYEKYKRITNETALSKLADSMHGLRPDQVSVVYAEMFGEPIRDDEPTTLIGDINIPDRWINMHFKNANRHNLVPVRNYSNGSMSRDYAEAMADFLVLKGVAVAAAGNQSTRITSWQEVMEAIGWK